MKKKKEEEKLEPKKRGPKTGSKNTPKRDPAPRARRKAPEALLDVDSGIKGLESDINILIERKNKEQNTDIKPVTIGSGDEKPKTLVTGTALVPIMGVFFEMLGRKLETRVRPSRDELLTVSETWASLANEAITLPPIWILAGTAIGTTVVVAFPMLDNALPDEYLLEAPGKDPEPKKGGSVKNNEKDGDDKKNL